MTDNLKTTDVDTCDDFRPTANWLNLRLRADLLRRLREFFDTRGFLEVETPILSADTVVDRHLDPFCTDISPLSSGEGTKGISPLLLGEGQGVRALSASPSGDALLGSSPHPNPLPEGEGTTDIYPLPRGEGTATNRPRRMWLQTSPEFAMKRLLAAGGEAIYQVARVFRLDELGPLHNPEFTLVEWYRAGDAMDDGMRLTSDLCEAMLGRGPAERLSYRDAFARYVGVDPHRAAGDELAAVARACGIEPPASLGPDDRDGWLDLLMVERIQPHLGVERPTLLYDYPASQAALARIRLDDPPVAERFELYVEGIELANGYHELLDAAELRARNAQVNAHRVADGKPALPEENRLLAAMEAGLPAAVGVALGFDRLAMLAVGAKNIAEVMAFPFDRA
jgi:elongation factor P--(R)-beta-lysine ligase